MSWGAELVILVAALLVLFATGLPIAFAMTLLGLLGLFVWAGPDQALNAVTNIFQSGPRRYLLTAIPTFILMAHLVIGAGIVDDLFLGISRAFAGVPAGLPISVIVAGTFFAAVTGASTASCAAIAPITMEQMVEKRKHSKTLALGTVGATGGLAIIIPPSIAFVLYGFVAQASITKLFIAGIVPGLILALAYAVVVLVWSKVDKEASPATPSASWKTRLSGTKNMVPIVMLSAAVLGFIYLGLGTPTEAAVLGTAASLILLAVYRKFTFKRIQEAVFQTMVESGLILFVILAAQIFSWLLVYLRIPQQFAQFVMGFGLAPILVLIMANVVLLILGCIMDSSSLLLVVIPVLLPILVAAGYRDLIWLGVVLVLNVEIGLTTPPVGLNLFVLHGVTQKRWGVTLQDVTKGCAPFLIAAISVLGLLIFFPSLTHILG